MVIGVGTASGITWPLPGSSTAPTGSGRGHHGHRRRRSLRGHGRHHASHRRRRGAYTKVKPLPVHPLDVIAADLPLMPREALPGASVLGQPPLSPPPVTSAIPRMTFTQQPR